MEFEITFQNTCLETMAFPTETTKSMETTKLFRINIIQDFLCMAVIMLSHNQFLKLSHRGKEKGNNYCK